MMNEQEFRQDQELVFSCPYDHVSSFQEVQHLQKELASQREHNSFEKVESLLQELLDIIEGVQLPCALESSSS